MGNRRIDLQRLTSDLLLLFFAHVLQRTHVVQTIGQLDQDDADILGHRDQQLAVIAGEIFLLILEFQRADLGDRFHQGSHLIPEQPGDILGLRLAILYRIMQEPGRDRLGAGA